MNRFLSKYNTKYLQAYLADELADTYDFESDYLAYLTIECGEPVSKSAYIDFSRSGYYERLLDCIEVELAAR